MTALFPPQSHTIPGQALCFGALRWEGERAAATPTPTYGMASAGDVWLPKSHAEPSARGRNLVLYCTAVFREGVWKYLTRGTVRYCSVLHVRRPLLKTLDFTLLSFPGLSPLNLGGAAGPSQTESNLSGQSALNTPREDPPGSPSCSVVPGSILDRLTCFWFEIACDQLPCV